MKILVKKEEISLLKKKLELELECINEEIKKMEEIKESFTWQGKSYNAFIRKYDERMNILKYKIKAIEIYVKFLDLVVVNYGEAIKEIQGEFKKLEEMKYGRKYI